MALTAFLSIWYTR